ncbi:MAG: polysaccharide biosynthesis protein [Muribaculaceae bacterium]|nr:polysaccharide biosynthesis protein [Muribaculaceae bacterium]
MVAIADLFIVAVSCILVYYFMSTPELSGDRMFTPQVKGSIVWACYALGLALTGASRSIIRLSVIEDTYRIVLLVVGVSIAQIIISVGVYLGTGVFYLSLWNIFVTGIFVFTFMFCMRLLVKYMYLRLSGVTKNRKRVIVLGSSINSYFLASALKSEFEGAYEPVALLSLSKHPATGGMVSGIPVLEYDASRLREIFDFYRCNTLMFLSTQIELMRNDVADIFLKNGIQLLMLNQVEEFDINSKSMPNLSGHVHNIKVEDLLGRETIHTDNPAIGNLLRDQTVMVTGAAGSIGSEIVRQVANVAARDIVLVDQAETPMHELQLEMQQTFPDIKIHLFIGDITNPVRMERAFKKYHPRYVFHAAAYKHVPMMERNPTEAVHTNVYGTKNIADLSVKYGVEKFVMVSTDKAVNPTNVMGASKRMAEIYVQSLSTWLRRNSDGPVTRFITTRFGNVLGSNGSVIPLFRKQIEEGGPVTITHRDIIRYFMTIPEACNLVLEAGVMGQGGEIYVFDMGKPVKIWDLAVRMIMLSGLKPDVDIKIVETGLRPGEKLYEELLNEKEHTTATHNKKIMIAKVRTYDYNEVVKHLTELESLIDGPAHDIVAYMKLIVPEYKSNNSEWESVDNELKSDKHKEVISESVTPT